MEGEFAGLARNREADAQSVRHGSADHKAARLDSDYGVNFAEIRLGQLIDHCGETARVGDQRREVPEHYSGLRKIRYIANQFFYFFGSHP
jgi:hypothetical protein